MSMLTCHDISGCARHPFTEGGFSSGAGLRPRGNAVAVEGAAGSSQPNSQQPKGRPL